MLQLKAMISLSYKYCRHKNQTVFKELLRNGATFHWNSRRTIFGRNFQNVSPKKCPTQQYKRLCYISNENSFFFVLYKTLKHSRHWQHHKTDEMSSRVTYLLRPNKISCVHTTGMRPACYNFQIFTAVLRNSLTWQVYRWQTKMLEQNDINEIHVVKIISQRDN